MVETQAEALGGGTGGGTLGSEGYKAITRNLSMSPLTVGLPVKSNIIVSHGFPRQTTMVVQLHVFKGLNLVFFTEEKTGLLDATRSHIIYGFMINSIPIIVANIFTEVLILGILFLKIKYG